MNKIDLVGFDHAVFEQIASAFSRFAAELGFKAIQVIPVSARFGDNVSSRSIARDPTGLYRRALAGEIKNFRCRSAL